MFDQVKQAIKFHHLLTKGERVIVGFSGGIDSLCLLHFLHNLVEYELDLWAVYVNYNLRPLENAQEMKLLEQVKTDWGVKTVSFAVDLPAKLANSSESLQLLAREERYRIFQQFSREIGATKVALAHHLDDQAETILYRIIRGTGLDGLTGMLYSREHFYIRPFLGVKRAEIREYALCHNLHWVEDSSNNTLKYYRNRLRHQLIPEIESNFNPGFKEALLRLSGLADEQSDLIKSILNGMNDILLQKDEKVAINLIEFIKLHSYLQYALLRKALQLFRPGYQLELKQLLNLREKICLEESNFKLTLLPKQVKVFYEKGYLFFDNSEVVTWQDVSYQLNVPGMTQVVPIGLCFEVGLDNLPSDWGNISNFEAYLEPEILKLPLKIRFWQPGDLFHPLGVHGSQKLQDFFVNAKVPKRIRHQIPLVVDATEKIVWVVGYRSSELFKVTSKTQNTQVWHVKVSPFV